MPYCPKCKDSWPSRCDACPDCAVCGVMVAYSPNGPGDLETSEVFCSPDCAAKFMVNECETIGTAASDTASLLDPSFAITDRESREFIARTLKRLCEMELHKLSRTYCNDCGVVNGGYHQYQCSLDGQVER